MSYQPGDIVGVAGGLFVRAACRIFTPRTTLYHYLVIGEEIPEEDDHMIFEAIASGVRVGRLSWYNNDQYVVFRVNHPESFTLGRTACRLASQFGRWGYDFAVYLYILYDVCAIYTKMLFRERRLRRIRPAELPYHENHRFICTELANAVWAQVGQPVIPKGVMPVPAGYVEALQAGRLKIVGFQGDLFEMVGVTLPQFYQFKV